MLSTELIVQIEKAERELGKGNTPEVVITNVGWYHMAIDNVYVEKHTNRIVLRFNSNKKELGIALDTLSDRADALHELRCVQPPVGCGRPINEIPFDDRESVKEYGQSGLCQNCQDEIFGKGFTV